MTLTQEQRAILAEIKRLDLLTMADAVECERPDLADAMRARAAMLAAPAGELATSCERVSEQSLTHDAGV